MSLEYPLAAAAWHAFFWAFAPFRQVVFVNLLIAMMSDRYVKSTRNAYEEWRYSRVLLVDEFTSPGVWRVAGDIVTIRVVCN